MVSTQAIGGFQWRSTRFSESVSGSGGAIKNIKQRIESVCAKTTVDEVTKRNVREQTCDLIFLIFSPPFPIIIPAARPGMRNLIETFVKSTEERWNLFGGPSWLFPELSLFMAEDKSEWLPVKWQVDKQTGLVKQNSVFNNRSGQGVPNGKLWVKKWIIELLDVRAIHKGYATCGSL